MANQRGTLIRTYSHHTENTSGTHMHMHTHAHAHAHTHTYSHPHTHKTRTRTRTCTPTRTRTDIKKYHLEIYLRHKAQHTQGGKSLRIAPRKLTAHKHHQSAHAEPERNRICISWKRLFFLSLFLNFFMRETQKVCSCCNVSVLLLTITLPQMHGALIIYMLQTTTYNE